MDHLGISNFFFNLLPFFNFQIVFPCRLVVVKYFRDFSEAHPTLVKLVTLSAILAVATKSQLGSILAWDLDAEHLLLRELESNALASGVRYAAVRASPRKLIVCSIESHLKLACRRQQTACDIGSHHIAPSV